MTPQKRPIASILGTLIVVWSVCSAVVGGGLVAGGIFCFLSPALLYPYLEVCTETLVDFRILVVVLGASVLGISVFSMLGVWTRKTILLQVKEIQCRIRKYIIYRLLLLQVTTENIIIIVF